MDDYSNIDDVIAALDTIIEGFGFDQTVGDRDLGRDCVGIFAEDVQNRASQQYGSEGQWEPNTDVPEGHGYASYKERVYGVTEQPNVRTGQMTSIESLSNATVGHEEVHLEYGTDEPPREGVYGRPVKPADTKITDREKARYAHEGQGPHGTKRPFYALSDTAIDGIQSRCQDHLDQYAEEIWSG